MSVFEKTDNTARLRSRLDDYQSKNSYLSQATFSLPRSRFSFRYAYCKSGFNLLLEIVGTEDTIRLGGLSDSPKQLRIDVHPKQVPVRICPQIT
jgi:hypothetical protein